jgi:glycosidase
LLLFDIKPDPEYDNFYIWHDGKVNPNGSQPLPPNNWVSVFHGSAVRFYEYFCLSPDIGMINKLSDKVIFLVMR